MSKRLSPALAEFAEGRWPDEWEGDQRWRPREQDLPQLDAVDLDPRDLDPRSLDPRSMEPPPHPSEIGQFDRAQGESGLRRWVPLGFLRFTAIFFVGVGATLAWQAYTDPAGRTSAGLGWMGLGRMATPAAPAAAPDHSADQLAALSRSLVTVRESVDRLAADLSKLQAAKQDAPVTTTSGAAAPASRPVRAGR
jgi:hypothetical protein